MRKHTLIIAISSIFLAQASFAADMMDDSDKKCEAVATACTNAGYTEGMGSKSFWFACMKPLLWDKAVDGVTLDKKDVKMCRDAKIESMKKDLKELEAIK